MKELNKLFNSHEEYMAATFGEGEPYRLPANLTPIDTKTLADKIDELFNASNLPKEAPKESLLRLSRHKERH